MLCTVIIIIYLAFFHFVFNCSFRLNGLQLESRALSPHASSYNGYHHAVWRFNITKIFSQPGSTNQHFDQPGEARIRHKGRGPVFNRRFYPSYLQVHSVRPGIDRSTVYKAATLITVPPTTIIILTTTSTTSYMLGPSSQKIQIVQIVVENKLWSPESIIIIYLMYTNHVSWKPLRYLFDVDPRYIFS